MQHLMVRVAKGLEMILRILNWVLNVCVAVVSAACISTYLYRTTSYRLEWATFMAFLLRSTIFFTVFVIIESILVAFTYTKHLPTILSCEEAQKKGKIIGKEGEILGLIWFVATTVGRFIRNGKIEGLTDNSWVASVYYTLFLTQIIFLVCKFFYTSYVYIRIAERSKGPNT